MALTAKTGRHPSTAEAMQDSAMDQTGSAGPIPKPTERYTLKNTTHVPSISLADSGGDPMLAISGYLLNHRANEDNGVRIWFTGKDPELQAKLQALISYSYGTESDVGDNSPNPWGMRLEAMLSEGAKFGARMFVLSQSLAMMRKIESMEAVVQSLLANTSTQAFFSPDPEDADAIRAMLGSSHRYGDITLDLPTLHCWLRARVAMHWQPPTLARIEPVKRGEREAVQKVIREVIGAHPGDYVLAEDWADGALGAIKKMLPPSAGMLLDELLTPEKSHQNVEELQQEARREELIQEAMKAKKKEAEEKGEDPATVTRPDAAASEVRAKELLDENADRLGFSPDAI